MENFRKAMYACFRQARLEIVPMDVGARVMAFAGLQGGDERVSQSTRLKCELEHLQELYHIQGGETPNVVVVRLIKKYTMELKEYTDAHDGEWTDWAYNLFQDRYGFKLYKL